MDRNLLLVTLSLACFYMILDEFVGKKRISSIMEQMTGGARSYGDSGGQVGEAPFVDPKKDDPNDSTDDPVDKNNPYSDSDVERGHLTSTKSILDLNLDRVKGEGIFA